MDREALGTGAAQAAAELRANLSTITAASQVLERSVQSEKERSYLASINQSIFRMLHLIGRMELAHCLTDEDEIRAKNAVYDLGPWLRELAARLGSVLAVNRIEFHAEHPECLLLYCDLPMLQQALLELVSAAAEGADRVVLTVAAGGKEVSLVVRGSGPVRTAEALSTLTDEEDVPNAIGKLRAIYPNLMKLDYDNTCTRGAVQLEEAAPVEEFSPLDLFAQFYRQQNNQPMTQAQTDFVRDLIETIWEEDAP